MNVWGERSCVQTARRAQSAASAILKYTVVLFSNLCFVMSGGAHMCEAQIKGLRGMSQLQLEDHSSRGLLRMWPDTRLDICVKHAISCDLLIIHFFCNSIVQ